MAVSLAPPWLPMIRTYILYRDATLSFVLRSLCLVTASTVIIIATSALAEDSFLNSCDNQDFDNVYYLLDKKDFVAAGDFFLPVSSAASILE